MFKYYIVYITSTKLFIKVRRSIINWLYDRLINYLIDYKSKELWDDIIEAGVPTENMLIKELCHDIWYTCGNLEEEDAEQILDLASSLRVRRDYNET